MKDEALEVACTKAAPSSVLTNEPRPPATLAPPSTTTVMLISV